MVVIQEKQPEHFDKVKNYIEDKTTVNKISSPDFSINEKEIDRFLNSFNIRPNLYAIFIKKTEETNWELKYIGQRQSKGIKKNRVN